MDGALRVSHPCVSAQTDATYDQGSGVTSVLLLDERPADRELLATVLRHADYHVIEASSGAEALALVSVQRPDLVISDIVMHGMNGYEFVHRLRGYPEIGSTLVMFTAAPYLDREVERLALACGVTAFLPKPADPETIVAAVDRVLGGAPQLRTPLEAASAETEQMHRLIAKLVERIRELEIADAERRRFLGQLMRTHEAERQRLAEGVHDHPIQAVAAAQLRLERLAREAPDEAFGDELERLRKDMVATVDQMRELLGDLHPGELHGQRLVIGLGSLLEAVRAEDGLAYDLNDELHEEPPEPARTLLYRAAREAIANVRRHARASRVVVACRAAPGGFEVAVSDDGVGFVVDDALRVRPGHLGLPALRERIELAGGSLRLESSPGAGATVEVWVP
jgi:signal transduction histidine kinase